MFAYHDGTGDYETHFEVISKLECMAKGMVWNSQTLQCTTEEQCLSVPLYVVSPSRECT